MAAVSYAKIADAVQSENRAELHPTGRAERFRVAMDLRELWIHESHVANGMEDQARLNECLEAAAKAQVLIRLYGGTP
jgi:hypothetical protein